VVGNAQALVHGGFFACVVDEIIAKGSEPKAYATYDLRNLPSS